MVTINVTESHYNLQPHEVNKYIKESKTFRRHQEK